MAVAAQVDGGPGITLRWLDGGPLETPQEGELQEQDLPDFWDDYIQGLGRDDYQDAPLADDEEGAEDGDAEGPNPMDGSSWI